MCGWSAAGIVILLWGVTYVNTRALLADFSALEIQVLRFGIAWLALRVCACFMPKRDGEKLGASDELLFAGMGFTGIVACQFLENCAIYYTNASNVAILASLGPIITALFAFVLNRKRVIDFCFIVGSMVAVGGVALVNIDRGCGMTFVPLGDIMVLGSVVSWGAYSILIAKANSRGISQLVVIRKTFFWALVMTVPLAAWGTTEYGYYVLDGSFSVTFDGEINAERFSRVANWVNLCFLGLLASALCYVLWNCACRKLGVVRATVGLYLVPLVGTVLAAVLLEEHLTVAKTVGCIVIILGVAIATLRLSGDAE